MSATVRVQNFATGKNLSFNQCHNKDFCLFSRESYFIFTFEGLGEFSTVMQTLDFVSGLHNCLKFSQHLSCLYQAMQTRKMLSIAFKYYTRDEPITSTGYIEKQINV